MGLEFALEELYSTGWSALDSAGCSHHTDGRAYPGIERIHREFEAVGYHLTCSRVLPFKCYRAEWCGEDGTPISAVVGESEAEAAVYALAQLRRGLVGATA